MKIKDLDGLISLKEYLDANVTSDPDEPIDGSGAVDILLHIRHLVENALRNSAKEQLA